VKCCLDGRGQVPRDRDSGIRINFVILNSGMGRGAQAGRLSILGTGITGHAAVGDRQGHSVSGRGSPEDVW
jgi:hypothetical protein